MDGSLVYVLENDSPLSRLLVWGLRQEGCNVVSAPLPSETTRFAYHQPRLIIINCQLPASQCRTVVQEVRLALPGVPILDLGTHDAIADDDCGADAHLAEPYNVADVVDWMNAARPVTEQA